MTIHKEGYTSIALCILFIFVSNACVQFYMPQYHTLKWIIYILSFILFIAVLYFFRSPSVNIETNEKAVLSPADGKVIAIEEVEESEFLKAKATQITIAISALDTHVNRNPVSGTVKYFSKNSYTGIGVENAAGNTILYQQVPGSLSKHILTYVNVGDTVTQGSKFGFTMLGSQINVFLPVATKIDVNVNDVVKGGQTVLGQFKS